ncbi:hypothetical protein M378DRAFT_18233 [Amanita muscaria Koide BX008]|uniref:Uncharacterized protein n=1 Tax=Amanita muscaria (strain Koide BX008) TaxID=946122 RepID=A0A0C2RXT0_AMAMK|nr:hypothetical protein M378DRAFT_18233 [Amanita muscaria Koide BX008]
MAKKTFDLPGSGISEFQMFQSQMEGRRIRPEKSLTGNVGLHGYFTLPNTLPYFHRVPPLGFGLSLGMTECITTIMILETQSRTDSLPSPSSIGITEPPHRLVERRSNPSDRVFTEQRD